MLGKKKISKRGIKKNGRRKKLEKSLVKTGVTWLQQKPYK